MSAAAPPAGKDVFEGLAQMQARLKDMTGCLMAVSTAWYPIARQHYEDSMIGIFTGRLLNSVTNPAFGVREISGNMMTVGVNMSYVPYAAKVFDGYDYLVERKFTRSLKRRGSAWSSVTRSAGLHAPSKPVYYLMPAEAAWLEATAGAFAEGATFSDESIAPLPATGMVRLLHHVSMGAPIKLRPLGLA